MISICIPIYNHDVRELVGRLSGQLNRLEEDIEIVCIDDKSRDDVREKNREIEKLCRYEELPENVGRSRIRNMFLEYVSNDCEYMIFMDCDLTIDSEDYVERYVAEAKRGCKVVVGGHRYKEQEVDQHHKLHYRYGTKCEVRTAAERSADPNKSFMTGNFMIAKAVLTEVRFDERIKGYGHEDTLMGYRLKQRGIEVKHIENPLWVEDLDDNKVFMNKTEVSVRNLRKIVDLVGEKDFENEVKLMTFYNKMDRWHMLGLIGMIYGLGHRWMRKRFEQGKGGMMMLKLYKLGLLEEIS